MFVEVLIQGNISSKDAVSCTNYMIDRLKITALAPAELDCLRMKYVARLTTKDCRDSMLNENEHDENSVISNYYQYGMGERDQQLIIDLLMDVMEVPCFNTLRTVKQLGYKVECEACTLHGIIGFEIIVCSQASKFTMQELDDTIEEFLADFYEKTIRTMTRETFEEHISQAIAFRTGFDESLEDEVERYWSEVIDQTYEFNKRQLEVMELKKLTLKDFKKFAAFLVPSSPFRKKLSIQIIGNLPADKSGTENVNSSHLPPPPRPPARLNTRSRRHESKSTPCPPRQFFDGSTQYTMTSQRLTKQ